jgi:hypothetical protein
LKISDRVWPSFNCNCFEVKFPWLSHLFKWLGGGQAKKEKILLDIFCLYGFSGETLPKTQELAKCFRARVEKYD